MRIAIMNRSARLEGGAETYVQQIVGELLRAGCEVALLHETDRIEDRAPMALPGLAARWNVEELGRTEAVARLRGWKPDVIYSQGVDDVELESQATAGIPTVMFAHNYVGVCISGTKTKSFPIPMPCSRALGPGCLAHYLPRRCGGLNPVRMIQLYQLQKRRLDLIRGYRLVLTASNHMRREYLRHGLAPERVRVVPFTLDEHLALTSRPGASEALLPDSATNVRAEAERTTARAHRLVWIGRMEELKGGHLAIKALPRVATALARPVHLTMIGHGRRHDEWAALAARVSKAHPEVTVDLTGWLDRPTLAGHLDSADLLVVSSTWPEPFGLVGVEAMFRALPAVAFDVGGISDWLGDGVNGMLAPGHPATVAGLADAIVRALSDDATLARLRAGARTVARRYAEANHTAVLLDLFRSIVSIPGSATGAASRVSAAVT
jgi:glycosyltransferase involved in cell wall biosynthesis